MNARENHEQTLLMKRDYENGDTLREISAKYGLTATAVLLRLRSHGVVMRPAKRRAST